MAQRRRRFRWGNISLPETEKFQFTTQDVWLSRHRKQPIKSQAVSIKCLNKIHKIEMRFPGRITLCHHPDLKGEITMMKLGGDKPECLTFLEQWRTEPQQCAANRPIVQKFWQAREDWKKSRISNRVQYSDWLEKPMKDRLVDRLDSIYNHLRDLIKKQFSTKSELSYELRYRSYNSKPATTGSGLIKTRVHFSYIDLRDKGLLEVKCGNPEDETE